MEVGEEMDNAESDISVSWISIHPKNEAVKNAERQTHGIRSTKAIKTHFLCCGST